MKIVRTSDQLADILTKRAYTTLQWQSLLQLWQIQQPYDHNFVAAVLEKLFRVSPALCPNYGAKHDGWRQTIRRVTATSTDSGLKYVRPFFPLITGLPVTRAAH